MDKPSRSQSREIENAHTGVHKTTLAAWSDNRELVRNIVREAMNRRRQVIKYHIAGQFLSSFLECDLAIFSHGDVEDSRWIRIGSLSQLRSTVGGRFQNLRDKWVSAGFPLRKSRGDRGHKGDIDSNAWIELSSWIENQGFKVRLASKSDEWLFEVQKLGDR